SRPTPARAPCATTPGRPSAAPGSPSAAPPASAAASAPPRPTRPPARRGPARPSSTGATSRPSFDPHAAPEGDAVLDLPRGLPRLRVVPRRVRVHLAAHHHVVVTGQALP